MKRTRFYNTLAKWLAIASLPCSSLFAQTPGTRENPILDSTLIVQDGVFLKYRDGANGDSTIWYHYQGAKKAMNTSTLFIPRDEDVTLRAKKGSIWYEGHYFFHGITLHNDSLLAPVTDGATYTWRFNNQVLASSAHWITQMGTGTYGVNIVAPDTNSVLVQYYYVIEPKVDPAGSSRSNAIWETNIIKSNFNEFTVNDIANVDSIYWVFDGVETQRASSYVLKKEGSGSVYIFKDGKWYATYCKYTGIKQNGSTLSIQTAAEGTYEWYKNGVLIPDSTRSTLGNIVTANYTVHVTWGPSTGIYQGQTGIYSLYIYQPVVEGTKVNPISVNDMVQKSGLTFSISHLYSPDSLFWNIHLNGSSETSTFRSSTYAATGDASIQALVFKSGKWYSHFYSFRGIAYDSTATSDGLRAPSLQGATYTWYLGDRLLPNETDSVLSPHSTGIYKVVISWIGGDGTFTTNTRLEASIQTAVFTYNVTSLPLATGLEGDQWTSENLQLYPNPATGSVSLQMPSLNGRVDYRIENASAATMFVGQVSEGGNIDISNLTAGVYYVHFLQAEKQVVKRLVVR